ncbi:hypothetical protein N9K51_01600 [bacterium]|nr:hypothetical protein [bacterium]
MAKHLTKPIRAIHFMVLAFLMSVGSQVVADQLTFKCIEQTPNGPQIAFLDVILEVNTSEQTIKINPQAWTKASILIDWGERFVTWVQQRDINTLLLVFDRETSRLVLKSVSYDDFDETSQEVTEHPRYLVQNYYHCTQKAF